MSFSAKMLTEDISSGYHLASSTDINPSLHLGEGATSLALLWGKLCLACSPLPAVFSSA